MVDRQPSKRGVQTTVAFFLRHPCCNSHSNQMDQCCSLQKKFLLLRTSQTYSSEFDCSLKCSDISPLTNISTDNNTPSESCPEYFKWIHEDLRPWKDTGITKEMVEKAKEKADINIVIVNGRLYTEKFNEVFQTRDAVTIWGILQLLRLYPGKLPDVDIMFQCGDKPVINKHDYGRSKALYPPPPMFHYCGDDSSFDIVFPDWSFWGWPELNIKPWEILKEDMQEGNSRIKWSDREPYAYWKGNAYLSYARRDLLKCNASKWNTRIDKVDWVHEKRTWIQNFRFSKPVHSQIQNLRRRSFVVFEWGNKHMNKAQEIGKTGSKYVQEQLRLKYVYDYMFHLLNEYSKLMKYKPTVPKGAVEVCSETMVCSVKGSRKKFRKHSMVKDPADSSPCTMPSSYYPTELEEFLERKKNLTKQVRMWEESESIEIATLKI
ncbi:hypothetical protein Adt_44998 [Abeliophyllum distichum]|uniref:Glycosyl transferase CAP10 domain-containing protein n=1 Tax=Abeliophyllum distichum TaxID=126358 RepID=A0ABD1PCH1_9LAMI